MWSCMSFRILDFNLFIDKVTCNENKELLARLPCAIRVFFETLFPWHTTHQAILLETPNSAMQFISISLLKS